MSWVLVLALGACQEKEKSMVAIQAVEYSSTLADETLPTHLTVLPGREAALWLRSNRDRRERTAVGLFRKALAPADTEALLRLLESADFRAVPDPGPLLPGEIVREIKVRFSDGTQQARYVGEEAPAPPAFARAEEALLKVLEATAAEPRQAVTLSSAPVPSAVDGRTPVAFRLAFSNVGRERVAIALPKAWPSSATDVEWSGVRSDVPPAEVGAPHQMRLKLQASHAAKPPEEEWRTLEPGAAVSVDFNVDWRWTPGEYDLELSWLSSLRDEKGRELSRFEWVSVPSRLRVK